jgi:bifunctional non-homologous end joining protein LigD
VLPRNIRPIRLSRRAEPFDSDQFIYELKIDGFRALAHIQAGKGELISRNGNTFHSFADLAAWIAEHFPVESAVLDDGATIQFCRGQASSRLPDGSKTFQRLPTDS